MIILEPHSFDPYAHLTALSRDVGAAGAIASLVGIVRGEGEKLVDALFLDHFPGATERAIKETAGKANDRWPLLGIRIVHRIGRAPVGDVVVLVAVAAMHRRPAFEACDFLMDYLKTDAPFWKKEIRAAGEIWIEPGAQDYADRARWR